MKLLQTILALAVVFVGESVAQQGALPVPTVELHEEFLIGEWKPSAPTIVVFKDPFCPYCLKALEKKNELDNVNLFLFWYPIFGEKSDTRVAEFFLCESPVEEKVISAVLAHQSPGCKGKRDKQLEAVNKQFYEAYSPPGVPSFYLGGRKVSFAEVKSIQLETNSGVDLDWERYSLNKLPFKAITHKKAAVYLGKDISATKAKKIAALLKTNNSYEWYLFPTKDQQLSNGVCSSLQLNCTQREKLLYSTEELELLYGLDQGDSAIIIDGRLVGSLHLPHELRALSTLL